MAERSPRDERANRRKVEKALVVSDVDGQDRVVAVIERVRHARYSKTVRRTKRLYVHDEENQPQSGTGCASPRRAPFQAEALAPRRGHGACAMIQQESRPGGRQSGAKVVLCIKVLGGSRRRYPGSATSSSPR